MELHAQLTSQPPESKIGTAIVALFFILILIGFASTGVTNFGSGDLSFGIGSSTLAKVGSEQVTEQDMSEAMQRRLQQTRQEHPDADYATIIGDFETILGELIDDRTLMDLRNRYASRFRSAWSTPRLRRFHKPKRSTGNSANRLISSFWLSRGRLICRFDRCSAAGWLQRIPIASGCQRARRDGDGPPLRRNAAGEP